MAARNRESAIRLARSCCHFLALFFTLWDASLWLCVWPLCLCVSPGVVSLSSRCSAADCWESGGSTGSGGANCGDRWCAAHAAPTARITAAPPSAAATRSKRCTIPSEVPNFAPQSSLLATAVVQPTKPAGRNKAPVRLALACVCSFAIHGAAPLVISHSRTVAPRRAREIDVPKMGPLKLRRGGGAHSASCTSPQNRRGEESAPTGQQAMRGEPAA